MEEKEAEMPAETPPTEAPKRTTTDETEYVDAPAELPVPAAEAGPEAVEMVEETETLAPTEAAEVTAEATATATATPGSPTSSDKSSGSSGNGGNKFYSLFESIQQNIEALNQATKVIEKINDRILFHSSTIPPEEESSLIQQVVKIIKENNIKARDTSRLVRLLRIETAKPTLTPGSKGKAENEKSEEEKAEESRDVGDKENICKTVTRSFTDELLQYQSGIQDFKNELKERLTKQVKSIRSGGASEDFIDLSLRSESSRYALFREIMATEETDLSEDEAKDLKDDIAEKYVVIAELSQGSSEMNKIFLALASSANKPAAENLSSSEEGDSPKRAGRTRRGGGKSPSQSSGMIDDLLGSRSRDSEPGEDANSPGSEGGQGDGSSTSGESKRKKNRIFSFMQKHRRASTGNAKRLRFSVSRDGTSPPRKRRNRISRWMTMFLLATVGMAAVVGLVMLH